MTKMVKTYKDQLVEYEIYKLVDFYDPILREPTIPFKFESIEDNKKAHYMAFSMAETLSELEGLGLSANQVGLKERVCAINMGSEIWTMFNPEIVEHSLVPATYQEGCLSYPGLYLKVNRWETIKVRFQAINGQYVEQEFSGMTAVCIQHELDHLDGIMFTDKVSKIKLEQAKRKVKSNVKRMRQVAAQRAALEKETAQSIVSEKQKLKPKPVDAKEIPQIKILDPVTNIEKTEEKFVYTI
jgi:peptide deformylase